MASRIVAVGGSCLFLFVAPGVVAGLVPYLLSDWEMRPPLLGFHLVPLLGAVLVVLGAVVLVDCFSRFAIKGRGTPSPAIPTEELVASGLYRYVRNPMYVAVLFLIVGQALILGRPGLLYYGIVVWLLFHVFVLLYEEPVLRGRFGASYERYRADVGRWWPRLTPWKASGRD